MDDGQRDAAALKLVLPRVNRLCMSLPEQVRQSAGINVA